MKKIILLLLIVSLPALSVAKGFELKIGAGVVGTTSIDQTNPFTRNWSALYGLFTNTEKNNTTFDCKAKVPIDFGLAYFFNKKMGVRLDCTIGKNDVDVMSSFNWVTNMADPIAKEWSSEGSVKITPIALSFVYRHEFNKKMKLNVFGGPALLMTKIDMKGHMGLAAYYYSELDMFVLDTSADVSKSVFGANIGFGFDYMFSSHVGMFVEFVYYVGGNVSGEWELELKKYTGIAGNLTFTPTEGTLDLENYGFDVSTSFYKAVIGLKFSI